MVRLLLLFFRNVHSTLPGRYSNIVLGTVDTETSATLSRRFGGSCSFESRDALQGAVSYAVVIFGCSAAVTLAAVSVVFVWTRFGVSNTVDSPEVHQQKFITRNLVLVAIAEILMTMPQAGLPLLFATRIQRIICADRHLTCSSDSIFPSPSVIADTNVYTSYLSSAIGASNFLGTLLIGSVSDIVGRRACILVVALGLVADSIICMLCSDMQVGHKWIDALIYAVRLILCAVALCIENHREPSRRILGFSGSFVHVSPLGAVPLHALFMTVASVRRQI